METIVAPINLIYSTSRPLQPTQAQGTSTAVSAPLSLRVSRCSRRRIAVHDYTSLEVVAKQTGGWLRMDYAAWTTIRRAEEIRRVEDEKKENDQEMGGR